MSDLDRYAKALAKGQDWICVEIEKRHHLYGYPPMVVAVGLAAVARGMDAQEAAFKFIEGEQA